MADITGTIGNDTIVGTAVTDTLNGAGGNDLIFGYGSAMGTIGQPPPVIDPAGGGALDNDSLIGGVGNDTVRAGGGNDTVDGGVGLDQLFGDDGNDSIDGGAGTDKMTGGAGNDTFAVDTAADLVTELAAGGDDRILSSVSLTIAANVETLQLAGAANINATGNAAANILFGNQGANILDGKVGADTMNAGDGDDVYVVDNDGDQASETVADALGGTDLVMSSVSHSLGGGIENLTLTGMVALAGTGNVLNNAILGNGLGNSLTGDAGNDTLNGGAGADGMFGGLGDDVFVIDNAGDLVTDFVTQGNDTIRWNLTTALNLGAYQSAFAEIENATLLGTAAVALTGTAGANVLEGNAGANKIDGNGGNDTMAGGAGNDVYMVDGGDQVFELAGGGKDLIISSDSFLPGVLNANVENLTLTGTAVAGFGNALANVILGNDADNLINGQAGADSMGGGKGDDQYVVDSLADKVTELAGGGLKDMVFSSVAFTLGNEVENLQLIDAANVKGTGNALGNIISGNDGNNVLDGKAGADTMNGFNGNDTMIVDNPGDVTLDTGTGIDQVLSSATHIIGVGIENLTLTGSAKISGTGNSLDNVIVGNSGANTLGGGDGGDTVIGGAGDDKITETLAPVTDRLDGGAGADTMNGGDGDDVYIVDNVKDRIIGEIDDPLGGVHDRIESSVTYSLIDTSDAVEDLTLTGAAAINGTGSDEDANIIIGNGGANKLFGLGNADTLEGGGGNDTLDGGTADAAIDSLRGGAGNDLYLLGEGDVIFEDFGAGTDRVESVAATTNLADNVENLTLKGAALDAFGNDSANIIIGNELANAINGGFGADKMAGGKGNDSYFVENVGDVVTEAAGGGDDKVFSSITYTLGLQVERLDLQGTDNINGTGNAAANEIFGNSGNNVLDGKVGADTLNGVNGNDTLIVDNAGDVTSDTGGDGGIDQVLSSVTHTIGAGIENLTLTGSAKIDGTGNGGDNIVLGNSGANTLSGGIGADTLDGGGGNDTLVGGDDNDTFLFHDLKSGKDAVQDFDNETTADAEVDTLDIGDVLVGYIDGTSNAHDFVQLSISAGITTVKVDADGLVGGSKFTDLCTVAFEDPSTASLDTLLANGNIVLT